MPLKVTFELSDRDLAFLRRTMREVRARNEGVGEAELLGAVARLLDQVKEAEAPDFVRERMDKIGLMLRMLEDADWALGGRDRDRVVRALAYFVEAEDLIPDRIPGIGYLDDAIMAELVVQELQHEIEAYEDLCRFREATPQPARSEAMTSGEWMEARRKALQARMRRRRRRRGQASPGRSRSPFSLF